jgi:hypothetical protein
VKKSCYTGDDRAQSACEGWNTQMACTETEQCGACGGEHKRLRHTTRGAWAQELGGRRVAQACGGEASRREGIKRDQGGGRVHGS